jgi:hypothetical protein
MSDLRKALWLCLALLAGFVLFRTLGGVLSHEEIVVRAPFSMPPIKVPVFPRHDFVITDYGASPHVQQKNSEALRQAIDACHQAGGGRVVVPAGEWLTGPIHLKSNVNLYLAKDSVLTFSGDPQDYLPAVQSS